MKITAPNTEFGGNRLGVPFVKGVGYSDDESVLRYFQRHGYTVADADEPPAEGTLAALRAYAKEKDIDLGGARSKADVQAAIDAAENTSEPETPADDA